jgi:hypothetical protein
MDPKAADPHKPLFPTGDFGPVTMSLQRDIPGVLKVRIQGRGGDADAALRRWRYNFGYARDAGLRRLLVILELTGPVISESSLAAMIGTIAAETDITGFRVALVQTHHERQQQDEIGTLLAMEHGASARVFSDQASALLWLRHGIS